jgi:hypothetical protein
LSDDAAQVKQILAMVLSASPPAGEPRPCSTVPRPRIEPPMPP